jgi:NAD(P)-dependent dehydrogenase (short-subunit alcohol dehydrogenase family)
VELEGKVALVTGASRGVGAAIAVALAEAGCDVACAARATRDAPMKLPGTLDETVERVEAAGRRGLAVPTNLAHEDEVAAMVERAADHFGRLDVLVNNAAITFVGDLDIPLKRHDLVMEVNLRAPFIAMRGAVPHLRAAGGGAILNLSSVAALLPVPGLMSYGVSKVALERMSVDVANQLRDDGIAVSVFRIDTSVASEGFVANTPGLDRSTWEPCEVAAEGVLWTLRQGMAVSGQLLSMLELREKHGIMASRAEKPGPAHAPRQMVTGLLERGALMFEDA